MSKVLSGIKPIGFEDGDGIKCLFYGRSGTGKTTLASTFPAPILWLVCSGGNRSGELRSIDTTENRKNIDSLTIERSADLKEVIEYLNGSESKYQTVVLDHATGLQDLILKEILGLEELPAQKGWGMATQQNYGQCTLQSKEILRSLVNLSINVVIVAQERESNIDGGSELITPTVGAGLTPSLAGWLNASVEYICQTFIRQKMEKKLSTLTNNKGEKRTVESVAKVKGVEYCLRTAPDPIYTTKFRIPKNSHLPEVLVDPSYEKIMELIRGGLDES